MKRTPYQLGSHKMNAEEIILDSKEELEIYFKDDPDALKYIKDGSLSKIEIFIDHDKKHAEYRFDVNYPSVNDDYNSVIESIEKISNISN